MEDELASVISEVLRGAIDLILHGNQVGLNHEDLSNYADLMVIHGHGTDLYGEVQEILSNHFVKVRDDILLASVAGFLSTLTKAFDRYAKSLVEIQDILMIKGPLYVTQSAGLDHVSDFGLGLFRDNVLQFDHVRIRLGYALDRVMECVDDFQETIGVRRMLIAVGVDRWHNISEENTVARFLDLTRHFPLLNLDE